VVPCPVQCDCLANRRSRRSTSHAVLTEPGANANNPIVVFGACLPATSASSFSLLFGPIPCNPPTPPQQFQARVDPGAPNGVIFLLAFDELSIVGRGDQFLPFGVCSESGTGPGCVSSNGTFTIAPAAAVVPEPGTWSLTLAGMAAAAAVARRRRRKSASFGSLRS
jgi:hypothetical protein